MRREEKRRRRPPRLLRRLAAVAVLALALILADVLSPYVKKWVYRVFPGVNYSVAAENLSHEMEKAAELIAVRYTDTGEMTGEITALFLGTVSQVKAPYRYEIGLGIKLSDVQLLPEETRLTVIVPPAQVLYDDFQITGAVENNDFWGLGNQQRYQQMVDDQHAACRKAYEEDAQRMRLAWETACEQLESLFRQWTGENLELRFLAEGE